MKKPSRSRYRDLLMDHAGVSQERCARCKAAAPAPALRDGLGWLTERWTILGTPSSPRLLCRSCALAEGVAFLAEVVSGPAVPPVPTLDAELWRSMRCRDGSKCACAVCLWEAKYGRSVAEWQRSQGLRPRARAFLPTLDHVLVAWAERTAYRSATGAILARARDEAQAPERSRVPWAIRRADVALEVERSVVWAFVPEHVRIGLATAICIRALVLAVRGVPVPDETLSKAVRLGRRGAMVDLAAREVIRGPRGARDSRAVADRVIELRAESERRRAG